MVQLLVFSDLIDNIIVVILLLFHIKINLVITFQLKYKPLSLMNLF